MIKYDRGDTATISQTFSDAAGQPADPATVAFRLRDPSGVLSEPVMDKAEVGRYVHVFVPDTAGVWRWRVSGTGGTAQEDTTEGQFYVRTDAATSSPTPIAPTPSALANHEADTTDVHGFANTALVETQAGAQAKVDTHDGLVGAHGLAVDACRPAFGASPLNADNTAAVQAAIDSLAGSRGRVTCSIPGTYTFAGATGLDAKRAWLGGWGAPGQNGGTGERTGGTVFHFTGTGGIFSSIKDDYGFQVENLEVRGSSDGLTDNGQVLIDYSGVNYPRLRNIRFWDGGTGLRLAKGAAVGAKECHYGAFFECDFQRCVRGVDFPTETGLNSTHSFFGGRFWSCMNGARIGAGVNNIDFFGTAFECGSGNTAVDSTGTNVSFFAVRWETLGTNLHVRAGAGRHFSFGCHYSSGLDVVDENIPSVVFGIDRALDSQAISASHTTTNLIANGAFKRDTDVDGRADAWLHLYSSGTDNVYSRVADPYGEGMAQQLATGTVNNARMYQQITCVPNVPHVLRVRARSDAGSTLIRIGTATTAFEWGSVAIAADNTWREYRIPFTPTAADVFVTFYCSSTTTRTLQVAGAVAAPGFVAPSVFVPRPITEDRQGAANPNTTGATLAALETEVNELKALLRSVGLMAS